VLRNYRNQQILLVFACGGVGEDVRARLFLKTGLTQEQLAEAADLYWTYISGIERGVRNASITSLTQIAAALNLRVRDFVREL
jgi:transcriptional regulator with XRE-family HTH domain